MADIQEDSSRLNDQHKMFIKEKEVVVPNLLGMCSVRVPEGTKWLRYLDGKLIDTLPSGPHRWQNGFFHKWEVQQINTRGELLDFDAKGRVKGPPLPADTIGGATIDLGCDVTAELQLSVKIVEVNNFMQHSRPLSIFSAMLLNMVVELIGKLPYDQYGEWTTVLRDQIRDRLQGRSMSGRENTEYRLGILVEDVFVVEFKTSTVQDRNTLQAYQQVAKARRELMEAQANAQRDKVVAESFKDQGNILNIAPSILALQNSPVGKALIERDAELQGLMVYAGLNPSVNVTMQDPMGQGGGYGQQPPVGYLHRPSNTALPPGPPSSEQVTGNLLHTGSFNTGGTVPPASPPPSPALQPLQPINESSPPVDESRQRAEITALEQAGFQIAGKGQVVPQYDAQGQPIPGTKEWSLTVSARRSSGGYLMIVFHCPMGYPATAPSVQVKSSSGGGLMWMNPPPNTIMTWHVGRKLVDIATELNADIP